MFLILCWKIKDVQILQDFPIQTDKVIKYRRPDIVCIDIAIPGVQNIIMKEQEKVDKYQDLQIELGTL